MDLFEKKRWLNQYRFLKVEVDELEEEVERLKSLAERSTTQLSHLPKAKEKEIKDQMAEITVKICDLTNEKTVKICKMLNIAEQIEKAIETVENPLLRAILEKRYIACKRWERIAVELHYSWKQIHRLHKKALQKIEIKDDIK